MNGKLPKKSTLYAQKRVNNLITHAILKSPEAMLILIADGFEAAAVSSPDLKALYNVWLYAVEQDKEAEDS